MTTKTKAIIGAVALIIAFAVGRYTVPVKVKTVEKIVEVEKKTKDTNTDTDRNKHKKTTVVEITKPDGTKEKTTTTTEDTDTNRKTSSSETSDKSKSSENSKETVRLGSPLSISVLSGVSLINPNGPLLGVHVHKDILGPISIGMWGLNNSTIGVSAGLSF